MNSELSFVDKMNGKKLATTIVTVAQAFKKTKNKEF